VKGGGD
jgi:hypothetical protein